MNRGRRLQWCSSVPVVVENRFGIKGQRQVLMTNRKQVVESWCWSQDAICQGLSQWHFHGDIYDDYEKAAAIRAAPDLLAIAKNDSAAR